jgi:tight adherence protein B
MLGIAGWIILNPFAALAFMVLGAFLPGFWVKQYRRRRIRRFNAQLMDALQAMANAFQAGRTFPQAVEQVAEESPAPLSQEFGLLVKELKLGVPMEEALVKMSRRVGSDDLDLVVTSANVARQLGGNMAEIFETIASTIRERFRLEGKIDALTAQGRIQGWIVGAMPLALGVVLWLIRPDLIEPLVSHWIGYVLIAVIAAMELLGMLVIRRIVNVDV